jgi:hypothetical protein
MTEFWYTGPTLLRTSSGFCVSVPPVICRPIPPQAKLEPPVPLTVSVPPRKFTVPPASHTKPWVVRLPASRLNVPVFNTLSAAALLMLPPPRVSDPATVTEPLPRLPPLTARVPATDRGPHSAVPPVMVAVPKLMKVAAGATGGCPRSQLFPSNQSPESGLIQL